MTTTSGSGWLGEMERIFEDCRERIHEAVRDYQRDLDGAIEELKADLAESRPEK